jgi:tetratricopeptide (TPR) repeat protein
MSRHYDKAMEAIKKRNYDGAIFFLLQDLAMNPDNVESRKALRAAEVKRLQQLGREGGGAMAYLKGLGPLIRVGIHRISKDHEKLMIDCEEFLKNAPREKKILSVLGNAARAAGYIDTAIATFEEIREIDRQNIEATRNLAQLFKEKENIPKALEYYERLRRYAPQDPEAPRAIRDLAAQRSATRMEEQKKEGDGSYRDLIKDKERAERLETESKRLKTLSDVESAIERIKRDLQERPDEPKLHKKLGDLYARKKEYDAALKAYDRARSLNPHDATIADAMGDLRIREYGELVSKIKEHYKKNPSDATKTKLKKAKQEKLAFCIEEYKRRVENHPTEIGLRYSLGNYFYKARRLDEAIAEFQKSVGDPRKKVLSQNMLGRCFAAKGLLDLAVKEFERAREGFYTMDETNKEITYNLGMLYEKLGKKEQARKEFEKIVEVDINYKDVMKKLEALK